MKRATSTHMARVAASNATCEELVVNRYIAIARLYVLHLRQREPSKHARPLA